MQVEKKHRGGKPAGSPAKRWEERRGEGRILVKEKLEIETVRRGTKRKNGEGRVSKLLVAVIRLKREVKIGAITRGIINL